MGFGKQPAGASLAAGRALTMEQAVENARKQGLPEWRIPMTHASKQGAPHMQCSICSRLSDHEYGYQKGGRPEEDLHLPAVANGLKTVQMNSRNSTGSLQQCTECGTYYLQRQRAAAPAKWVVAARLSGNVAVRSCSARIGPLCSSAFLHRGTANDKRTEPREIGPSVRSSVGARGLEPWTSRM